MIDYLLRSAAGVVSLEIVDARGETVRAFSTKEPPEDPDARRYFTERWVKPPAPPSAEPGHHRFVWDLRYARPKAADYEYMIAAVDGEDTPIEPRGPLAPPGRYTVRLTAGGKRLEQTLVVTPDPRTTVPAEVFADKLAVERRIVAAMNSSFEALEAVRALRKQSAQKAAKGPAADSPDAGTAALEADLAKTNRLLGTILNQIDQADAPATVAQMATLKEALAALDGELARWSARRQGR